MKILLITLLLIPTVMLGAETLELSGESAKNLFEKLAVVYPDEVNNWEEIRSVKAPNGTFISCMENLDFPLTESGKYSCEYDELSLSTETSKLTYDYLVKSFPAKVEEWEDVKSVDLLVDLECWENLDFEMDDKNRFECALN